MRELATQRADRDSAAPDRAAPDRAGTGRAGTGMAGPDSAGPDSRVSGRPSVQVQMQVTTDLSGLYGRAYAVDPGQWHPLAAASAGATVLLGPHVELVAWGEAARIRLPAGLRSIAGTDAVSDMLRRVGQEDAVGVPGGGPLALAALPFDPAAPCDLIVPRWIDGRNSDGLRWRTEVGPSGGEGDGVLEQHVPPWADRGGTDRPDASPEPPGDGDEWSPDRFDLQAGVPHAEFCKLVELATERIGSDSLQKVVLARDVRVSCNRPLVLGEVLSRLRALFPSCTLFSVEGFVGATPELLVRLQGRAVLSRPLAGTAAHSGDTIADALAEERLMESAKDRREHRLAVRTVAHELSRFCSSVSTPGTPEVLRLRNVSHLASPVRAVLDRPIDAAGLAAALHPTGAVCGYPRQEALRFLADHEPISRGRYAGPVGWVDRNGDGEWWVGIRSAEVHGSDARLFAGVGVVEGSQPRSELAETQLKLQALLAALVRP